MGMGHEWVCNACGYEVKTSGSWEFYRDSKGQRQPYGHPAPESEEAKNAGIKGFDELAYCPVCDKVQDVILVEFETPRDYHDAWQGLGEYLRPLRELNEFRDYIGVPCPECQGKLYDLLHSLSCPRCKEGMFKLKKHWVS